MNVRSLWSSLLGAALFVLAAGAVSSQERYKSVHTAIIEAGGPKAGDNGVRYFNVEGKEKGKYACYGIVQFDSAEIKGALDKKYGAGKYKIIGLTLELTQSNASFSAPGAVNIFYLAGRVDIPSLKYPLDPTGVLKPEAVSGVKFALTPFTPVKATVPVGGQPAPIVAPAAAIDKIDLLKSKQGAGLPKSLLSGPLFSLALAEVQPGVAATWAGQANNRLSPPTLVVTAVKK